MKRTLTTLWIFAITIFGMLSTPVTVMAQTALADTAVPVRLKIPALNIDAVIQSVGKDSKGNMSVPSNSTDVAWYKLGARPGTAGNAVISGHYDDKVGPAIFYKLGKLKKGDTLSVLDSAGVSRNFAVVEVASYPYDKAPLNKIFGFDLEHDLNLITCGGRWNTRTHTYNQRLVVSTRLINP